MNDESADITIRHNEGNPLDTGADPYRPSTVFQKTVKKVFIIIIHTRSYT